MMSETKIKKKMLTLKCEICSAEIGLFDPDEVKLPIEGHMFKSIDEKHGFPPPFHPSLTWETMRCPMCRYRPFYEKDTFLTTEGPWHPVDKEGHDYWKETVLTDNPAAKWMLVGGTVDKPLFECGLCHKTYKTEDAFNRYHKCPNLA